ncbi:fungal-specific transcription factor domain-containing protein [Cercophora newfieldiana]|uniref:Fungal-specific transcription factor domain-containing protein n=1 Tax=Cercophora newfieldiana TaxID=92897 RepID=A0AA40CNZ8_9PEZI|nr:fungal-specific transcription factor domain-containing protein [Cercophora newfieldiana]
MMGGSPGSPGGADGKKGVKRQPLRSSIACQRCRKSKIKCNNTGGDAPCETCIRNGKECTYPEVTPAPPKRPEPPTGGIKTEQGSERKRLRKLDDIAKMDSAVPAAIFAEEVLSAPYLSESIWSQIFDIYRVHFATELPFLHLATLKEKMNSKFRAKQSDTSPEINLVLLGILTLTARFHSTLVSYVTTPRTAPAMAGASKPRPTGSSQDASAASEYYAEVLTKAIGGLRTSMTVASVERVQAFLMLGLYEWSQARPKIGGMAAWMYVGVAIRMAQALGLGEGDKDQEKSFRSLTAAAPKAAMTQSQMMIAKEIRRRTMFSCLILDRLLGCGKGRVSTIRSEDLQIQLPCSEVAFDLSEDVYTGFLKPSGETNPRMSINDSVLSRFVRLIDIWGEISKWSFAGGRFTEKAAPWSPDSTFYQLRKKLQIFYMELPELFQWSTSNYYKHENHQASSVYVSMHMLGAVCRIMLHREYIPFIPIRCNGPVGPLDEPTFSPGTEPSGFWDESAEEIFHAARDIVDLIDICRDKLPMSALVLFAVWTAAFVGVYAVCFPHMDTKRHMLPSDEEDAAESDITKSGATGVTYKTLKQMSMWLKMAETYATYFRDMASYYEIVKQDYHKQTGKRQFGTAEGPRLSVRIGGGGLEEWKQQGLKIVNNGEILAYEDDGRSSSRDSTMEPSSSVGPENGFHGEHTKTPRSTSLSFTPINTGHHQPDTGDGRVDGLPNVGGDHIANHWRFPPTHSHSHHQQSPSQSSYAMPSPQMAMGAMPNMPMYGSTNEVVEFLTANQSMPWYLAPGGIDQFAHGTEELVPVDNGNGFWGSMLETGMGGVCRDGHGF